MTSRFQSRQIGNRTKRVVTACLLGAVLILAQPHGHAAPGDALPFFTSYTVTGNYAVAGIDLLPGNATVDPATGRKFVTGTLQMSGVPANADIVAAWLYWETIWDGVDEGQLDGARFRGQPLTAVRSSTPVSGLTGPYSPCWSGGGNPTMTMSRADVRRLLPPQLDSTGMPTGRRVVNHADLQKYQQAFPDDDWLLTVTLPEAGTGNQLPQSAGASLVIIYRDPDPNPEASPVALPTDLRTIVLYDGVHVQSPGATMQQTIRGFLQSKTGNANARMTHIGGSGSPNATDQIRFSTSLATPGSLLGTNQFVKLGGGTSDRAWSNPTFPNASAPAALSMPGEVDSAYGEQVKTTVTHASSSPYDCLSWAAVVFSTKVQDADPGGGDGIIDALETSPPPGGFLNPAGLPYPNVAAMGASPTQRDLFIEIGAMRSEGFSPVTPGHPGPHDHMPSEAVLKIVDEALRNPPPGQQPVYAHFDVGTRGYMSPAGNPHLFVPAAHARGGESIDEQSCDQPYPACRFPGYAGVVSWPTGYQFLTMAPVGPGGQELLDPEAAGWCDVNSAADCRRRFDLSRQGIFRYMLYAHARGTPKSELPCLIPGVPPAPPTPTEFGADGTCGTMAPNPNYYIPKSTSGASEIPGRYAMVTLGLWDGYVGTERMQANTTLHELGHMLGLWHGGRTPTFTYTPSTARADVFVQPNCKPNYLSVMSYLFQASSLVDDLGVAHTTYSNDVFGLAAGTLNEATLFDGALTPTPPYRTAWYAPAGEGTLARALGIAPATKYCSGARFASGVNPSMARLNAAGAGAVVDWAGDGALAAAQDVNFDGHVSGPAAQLTGFNDWDGIRLNQGGAGRNFGGFSVGLGLDLGGPEFGGLDFGGLDFGGLDFGGLDFGGLDFGGLDFGGLDFGGLDFGGLDFGGLDFGGLDFGGLDFGGLDFGGLDFGGLDFGGLDFGGAELDYFDVLESGGGTAPNEHKACVLGGNGATPGAPGYPQCVDPVPPGQLHRDRLNWTPPIVGTPTSYSAFRVWDPTGTAIAPVLGSTVVPVGTTPNGVTTTLDDSEALPNGERFIYFVRASIEGALRALSNFAIVTAQNDAPFANNDPNYTTPAGTQLNVNAAVGVLGNDTDADSDAGSLQAVLVSPPAHGSLVLNADGSFTYMPNPGFAGTDTFTYVANNGWWSRDSSVPMSADSNIATVSIAVSDATPPVVVLTVPPPNGLSGYFVTSPVLVSVSATDPSTVVSFSCTDKGAAIAVGSIIGLGTSAASGTLSVSSEGTHNLVCVATDGAGNTGAAPGSSNTGTAKIDTNPPTIAVVTPTANGLYLLNASIASSYTCTDAAPGSGVASCSGSAPSGTNISTSPVGSKTFNVQAADVAGNAASLSRTYYVRYNAVIAPPKNGKLGSAIPLTWELKDANGTAIVRLTTLIKLTSVFNGPRTGATCAVNSSGPVAQHYNPATGATGGSDYRLVSGGYKFNWDTTSVKSTGRGCYTLIWQFDDNAGPPPGYAVLNGSLLAMKAVEVQ